MPLKPARNFSACIPPPLQVGQAYLGRTVLANSHHFAAPTGAKRAVRFDDGLDARQVSGQIAFGRGGFLFGRILRQADLLFFDLGNRHFKVFKAKLPLIFRQLFRLLPYSAWCSP